jgi:hypothetical protein
MLRSAIFSLAFFLSTNVSAACGNKILNGDFAVEIMFGDEYLGVVTAIATFNGDGKVAIKGLRAWSEVESINGPRTLFKGYGYGTYFVDTKCAANIDFGVRQVGTDIKLAQVKNKVVVSGSPEDPFITGSILLENVYEDDIDYGIFDEARITFRKIRF